MAQPPTRTSRVRSPFLRFAQWASHATGRPLAFQLALLTVIVWAATGPVFGYSDTWQLVINTGTTIVTFLMVFLIQATQNRDTAAMHVKLDELIRVIGSARNGLLDLEQLEEADIEKLRAEYLRLAEESRRRAPSPSARSGPQDAEDREERPLEGATRCPVSERPSGSG
jgi:low affinity Fe/Cu permease